MLAKLITTLTSSRVEMNIAATVAIVVIAQTNIPGAKHACYLIAAIACCYTVCQTVKDCVLGLAKK